MPDPEVPPTPTVQLDLQPVPTRYEMGRAVLADGQQAVILRFYTPQGLTALFFDGPSAIAFGEAVANEGRSARLSIMPAGTVPLHTPNGHGPGGG